MCFFHTEHVRRINNRIDFESQFRSQLNLKTFSMDFFFEGKIVFRIFWKGTLIHVLKRWHLQGVGKKLSFFCLVWSTTLDYNSTHSVVHCGKFKFILSISSIWVNRIITFIPSFYVKWVCINKNYLF